MVFPCAPRVEEFRTATTKRWVRCWQLARNDGVIKRFTNASNQVQIATAFVDGVPVLHSFTPVDIGASRESTRRGLGNSPDTDSVVAAISATGWTVEDARVGLLDNVRVDVWDVDWRYPFAGYFYHAVYFMVDHKRSGEQISFRLATIAEFANVQVGRLYQRRCDAILGDDRCGVDLSLFSSGTKTVTAQIESLKRLRFESTLTTQPDDYWTDGQITWLTGLNAITGANSQQIKRSIQADGVIELWTPTPYNVNVGDTFSCVRGCNKLFNQHCRIVFGNGDNFRGFKEMVGIDQLIKAPDSAI